MKKIFKLVFAIFILTLGLPSYANEDNDLLKDELYGAIKETIDGKLYYQVNIKTVYGPSDINIYMANTDEDYMPAASTIKPFIGLALLDKVEKGEIAYTADIKKDLDLSLRLSDNDATNRLIEKLGGFDEINTFIEEFTGSDMTRLNRFMLKAGEENTTNAKDLSKAIFEIFISDNDIGKDMARSLSNSSNKRAKLLKNINPYHRTMNKTGELKDVENDLALVKTDSEAYIISLMTKNDDFMDKYEQVLLINKLGEKVGKAYENYEKSYQDKKTKEQDKINARLTTSEKKLAYAIYNNQIFYQAGEILLDSDLEAVDDIRFDLRDRMAESEGILEESKKILADLLEDDIKDEDDLIVSLVRLIYTDQESNADLDRNLALAFYNNKATVRAAETLLSESPKTSLGIRRPLVRKIQESEELFSQTDLYFDSLNEIS